ncbi:hypothetical protein NDU88_007153 [Pleurodeles waltl]|uniref:Uncharacterized protein n=1 Tax=Pleurodeles waltl TaxID=8319 RepID=A0AAV7NSV1_PLEWA|nr:hypothetical protein NDU88_007153 [Pleurodeles waltl]
MRKKGEFYFIQFLLWAEGQRVKDYTRRELSYVLYASVDDEIDGEVSVRRVILKRFIAGFFRPPFPPPRYRCSLAVQRVPLRVPFGKLLRPVSAFTSARLSGELLRFSRKPLRSLPFR